MTTQLPADDPTRTAAWSDLARLAGELGSTSIRDLIDADPNRPAQFTHHGVGIDLDLSDDD